MIKQGFDNDKYLAMQSDHIRERISKFGDKLYLYLKTDATPTSYPPIPLKEVSPLPQTCAKKKATK